MNEVPAARPRKTWAELTKTERHVGMDGTRYRFGICPKTGATVLARLSNDQQGPMRDRG